MTWFTRRVRTSSPISRRPKPLAFERLEDRLTPAGVGVSVGLGDINGDGYTDIVAGAGAGHTPQIKVFSGKDGSVIRDFLAFDESFTGGVFVAVGDVTGDGRADIAVGAGNGGGPQVKLYDGVSGDEVQSFFPYEDSFRGGVNIGLGDVNRDGFEDLICGTGVGGGPRVVVYSGQDGTKLMDFFAYESSFRGGVNAGGADVNGDGFDDVLCGTGVGGGPRIIAFDGRDGTMIRNFFAYEDSFRGGVSAAAADLDGDGRDEILAGSGVGGGPVVKAFGLSDAAPVLSYLAFDGSFRGGVNVAGGDVNGDGKEDIIAGSGPGNNSLVLGTLSTGSSFTSFSAFDGPPPGGFATRAEPQLALQYGSNSLSVVPGTDSFLPVIVSVKNPSAGSRIRFSQTITPSTGLTINSDHPGSGWTTTAADTSFTVSQTFKGITLGTYTVRTTATIEGTAISVSRDLTVRVVTTTQPVPALTAPTTFPSAIPPNSIANVLFTTVLTGTNTAPASVTLEEVDVAGNVLDTVGSLRDDGTNGDLVAGDNVYSGAFFNLSGGSDTLQFFRTRQTIGSTTVTSASGSLLATDAPTSFAIPDTSTAVTDPATGYSLIPNQLLVKFAEGTTFTEIQAVATAEGGTLIGASPALGFYQFTIPGAATAATVNAAIVQWQTHAEVVKASANSVGEADTTIAGDDTTSGGYWYDLIRADEARVVAEGFRTLVAVLDTGVDYNHSELAPFITKGPDFGMGDDDPADIDGHGTHVAGLIAASRGDGGTTGISGSPVLAVKVFGDGSTSLRQAETGVSAGIEYAVARGAKIISMSLGGFPPDSIVGDAVAQAQAAGRLVVASAGNLSTLEKRYPAAFEGVLSVGNTNSADVRSPSSNYGDWVRITAPGEMIRSTVPLGPNLKTNSLDPTGYRELTGTSMSTPIVSGAAALVWNTYPELTAVEVQERLVRSAKPFDPFSQTAADFPNAGRLDVFEAIVNGSFENGLTGWTTSGTTGSLTALGPASPITGSFMGYVSTGPAGAVTNASLEYQFTPSAAASTVTISLWYQFITEEFPEFVGTKFNDVLIIEVEGPGGGTLATESVNGSAFTRDDRYQFPGGDSSAGTTGWRRKELVVPLTDGATYNLRIRIADAGDGIFDSVALIDGIEFR